jgi:hypothetical protein
MLDLNATRTPTTPLKIEVHFLVVRVAAHGSKWQSS